MPRWSSTTLLVLLGILAAGLLFGQLRWIPALADNELRENPSAGALVTLVSLTGIALGVCGELALLAVARLVLLVRRGRIFDRRAFGWVDVVTAASAVASAIVLVTVVVVEATDGNGADELPPGLGALMVGVALALAALSLLMVVMKALLRQAVALDAELREVV
jgi:hypothetical protein